MITLHLLNNCTLGKRILTWPRGYPGDADTVELIINRDPNTPDELWNFPLAVGHRNRIEYIKNWILNIPEPKRKRILLIGCGHAHEIPVLPSNSFVTLFDQDAQSLQTARTKLKLRGVCNQTVQGGLRQLFRGTGLAGKYDIVICAGMGDYFSDSIVIRLLNRMQQLGTRVLYTNVDDSSLSDVDKYVMDDVLNWHLVYRDRAKCLELGLEAGWENVYTDIDDTKTQIFLSNTSFI